MLGIVQGWVALLVVALAFEGCARAGLLKVPEQTIAPVEAHSSAENSQKIETERIGFGPLFGDTLIGLVPGTGDSTRRYLGRLRDGYTADTLNIMVFGDNRPGYRSTRLHDDYNKFSGMFKSPRGFLNGLIAFPVTLVKGLYPDLALVRDIPARMSNHPTWGREHQVLSAMMVKIDSLKARGQSVSAVLNSGDLVNDGRIPQNWERFLRITRPLSSRVPYFPVAGNHERTDTVEGIQNWRTATGLPVGGERLFYCFDSADGWVRFIALDSNPMVDPRGSWTREVQIKASNEQFTWLVDRVKEHNGPVIVLMHHPPFSSGFHHVEWQVDSVLQHRREQMVRALHESGISVVVGGHEHGYERALLTWPDAVLVAIVTGGAGAPLHTLPQAGETVRMFTEYRVAGGHFEPKDIFSAQVFHYILFRLWFGGGEFYTYAVDDTAGSTQIDKVKIDLERYGVPQIDQHKIPVAPATGPKEKDKEMAAGAIEKDPAADSTAASRRVLSKPSPVKASAGKRAPTKPAPVKKKRNSR